MESNQPTADRPLYIGFWLRHVANHVVRAFAYKLKDHDVTVAECTALRQLFSVETMAPSRLAARTGMTHDKIIKLTDRLIARSLVAWTDHAQDAGSQMLSLTPVARTLVPVLAELADANDAECFNHLPQEDQAALVRILPKIVDNEPSPDGRAGSL